MNYIAGIMLYYIPDEEQVFWCLVNLMQSERWQWRFIYTEGFPKLQTLLGVLQERMQIEFPRIYKHLQDNFLEIIGTFTPLIMTLFVYMTPLEVSSRLFELFLIDGEHVLLTIVLKMIELK